MSKKPYNTPQVIEGSAWICEVCHQPIGPGEGAIELRARTKEGEIRGYPEEGTAELPPPEPGLHRHGPVDFERLKDQIGGGRISIQAVHYQCDPYKDRASYPIATKEAGSLEAWCSWVIHLHEKTWMGRSDLRRLLAYWFTNRKIEFADVSTEKGSS